MTIKNLLPVVLGSTLLFASCGNTDSTTDSVDTATVNVPEHLPIELTPVSPSPEYPGASLTIGNVTTTPQGTDSVKVSFNFNVKNYDLKAQTVDAAGKLCNNSAQGQHIHFIIDNKPYVALYEPRHETVVAKNTEHNVLVFLSRSYHESVKSRGASELYSFRIDANGKLQRTAAPKTPMVFYSRPKGDYLGKDTENVLLDFYVLNTTLAQNGHQVRAHVAGNGVDTTFTLTEWKPRFLKHLPMGKNSITLTLLDQNGNRVSGPETEVTREFNLSLDEPMTR